MLNITRRTFTVGAAAAASTALVGPAAAQSDNVTFIVPFSAGSGPDFIARLFADYLTRQGSARPVVENRVGASGNIGSGAVARATPDGKTFLVTANTLVMNSTLFKAIPYDPVTSFEPVVGFVYSVFALAVHRSLGANSLADLIRIAKEKPGELNFGSPGLGSPHHLGLELFKQKAGADLKHVPYAQIAGAMKDVAGGHITGMLMPATQAVQLAQGGDVKVLAFSGNERAGIDANVPTFAEAGVAGVDIDNWWAMFAPAGTPAEIINRYNKAANDMLADPEIKKRLEAQALQPIGGPPSRLKEILERDAKRWADVIKTAGITSQ